ncbi:FeoA family protein [Demequina lutea]|uniref:Ferrous iron transport protein A n=1 Tax=Demequina lutea TaxID=431489 RepID=A0A7Y9ZAT2_9MICO|nr:FeoA family protein [Demequina lutea]NYI39896.1 ferrous iron transport protein A [Demequina lutea]
MLLSALRPGVAAHVRAVSTESSAVLRLREMGLRPGALVRMAGRGAGGSRIITIGAARIAIDGATAALIDVEAA